MSLVTFYINIILCFIVYMYFIICTLYLGTKSEYLV